MSMGHWLKEPGPPWWEAGVTPSKSRLTSLWHAAFTGAPLFLFLLPDHRLSSMKNMYIYIYIVYIIHFYTNREQCEVLTGYSSLGYRPASVWTNAWHWTCSLQTESSSGLSYCHSFFLLQVFEEAFTRNIILYYVLIIQHNYNMH
jgi:hypothetical protein